MKQSVKLFGSTALVGALMTLQPTHADEQAASRPAEAAPGATVAAGAAVASVAGTSGALYTVVDGDSVDASTLKGWRTWRAMACDRCHGPNQEGLVGPSLVQSLKVLTQDEFKAAVLNGRIEKGMPNFGGTQTVVDSIDGLYAYLKGRSDGAIQPGKLKGIE